MEGADLAPPGAINPILTGVSLSLNPGEIGILLGSNGSGKTTLLRTAAGLWDPLGGRIRSPSRGEFDPTRVGLLLEDPSAQFVAGTVREEIEFALENLGLRMPIIAERVDATLQRMDLASIALRDPRTLSPGEQQRCLLAASLAPGPDLLLLDDPFLYLGPGEGYRAWQGLVEVVRTGHVQAALLATHDAELATEADRVGVLAGGELSGWGSPLEILDRPLPEGVDSPLGPWLVDRLAERGWKISPGAWDPAGLVARLHEASRS
jgi:energy-coupling factor transporter ATP-binding protein EcfA2